MFMTRFVVEMNTLNRNGTDPKVRPEADVVQDSVCGGPEYPQQNSPWRRIRISRCPRPSLWWTWTLWIELTVKSNLKKTLSRNLFLKDVNSLNSTHPEVRPEVDAVQDPFGSGCKQCVVGHQDEGWPWPRGIRWHGYLPLVQNGRGVDARVFTQRVGHRVRRVVDITGLKKQQQHGTEHVLQQKKVYLISWCFERSQPLRIISGLSNRKTQRSHLVCTYMLTKYVASNVSTLIFMVIVPLIAKCTQFCTM